jgi:hypothetical protein
MLGQETEIQSLNNGSDTQHICSRCHDILPSVVTGKIWAKKVSKAAWKLEDQYLDQFGWKLSEYTRIGERYTETVQVFSLILATRGNQTVLTL